MIHFTRCNLRQTSAGHIVSRENMTKLLTRTLRPSIIDRGTGYRYYAVGLRFSSRDLQRHATTCRMAEFVVDVHQTLWRKVTGNINCRLRIFCLLILVNSLARCQRCEYSRCCQNNTYLFHSAKLLTFYAKKRHLNQWNCYHFHI